MGCKSSKKYCNMDKKECGSCKYINLKDCNPCGLNNDVKGTQMGQPGQCVMGAQAKQVPQGKVTYYKSEQVMPGEAYEVENKNYYDNYYTKYNHYYVTDVNYVTDHVKEYDVVHKTTKTVYNGTNHQGCSMKKCKGGDCKHCKCK